MAISSTDDDLHIVFLPFLAPGHMIPLVDIAKAVAARPGVRATIVTTTGNAPRIRPAIDATPHPITLLTLPFPSATCPENVSALPTPRMTDEFLRAIDDLELPFEHLIANNFADCIVADFLFPWATDVAVRLGIPKINYASDGSFPCVVISALGRHKPHEAVASKVQPFLVPGLPHPVHLTASQVIEDMFVIEEKSYWADFLGRVAAADTQSYGTVINSFYEMEPDYVDMFKSASAPRRLWNVGPVSLCNQELTVRGGELEVSEDCLRWLENKNPGSVLYVCFGSAGQLTAAQLREVALGLESSDHPYIWVVRGAGDESEWMPDWSGKGLIVRGWVPQVAVLNHRAVGGFVTHCGWNSTLEGVSAGVPMITWPLFYDQFFIEKLIVDVLKIGVAAGSMVSSYRKEDRTLVRREQLREAVNEVMREGGEAEERRRRAKKLAVMAKDAVVEGGSSYKDMTDMIQALVDKKKAMPDIAS